MKFNSAKVKPLTSMVKLNFANVIIHFAQIK